jgi:RsiW-degrading membrane proteinase PrsW (M82 family)
MTLSPILATLLELGILVIVLVFIIIVIRQDSSLMSDLQITATRLANGQENPEVINNILSAFISRPVNRFLIFSIVSGLIPIIEEVVKQIPLWLLSWRKLTPRAGFLVGALSGAGFALFEGLMATSSLSGSEQWLFLMFGRAGASMMHVLTGAIGGWGLASAIQGRSYMKAVLAYITCIFIHGAWNAMATWEGISRLVSMSASATFHFSKASLIPLVLMGVLFLFMLVFLIKNNKIIKD